MEKTEHLAIASVPIQQWNQVYDEDRAFQNGTLFPDLYRPFCVTVLDDKELVSEQKARTVYDNLLRMITDPEIREPLKFLRAREIVHFQRFGEALERTKDSLDARNFYYCNPEFDKDVSHGIYNGFR